MKKLKLKCRRGCKQGNKDYLLKDKIYKIESEYKRYYFVTDEEGYKRPYDKKRFEEKQD